MDMTDPTKPITPPRVYVTNTGVTPNTFTVSFRTPHGDQIRDLYHNLTRFEYAHRDLIAFMSGMAWTCHALLPDLDPTASLIIDARTENDQVLRRLELHANLQMTYDAPLGY